MRIKVDFSEFFGDERKLSVVSVDTQESITVRDVLEKIVRSFKLTTSKKKPRKADLADEKPEYGLFEDGFYVPPEETSTVLQGIGILKLQSLSDAKASIHENSEKKKKHKKRKNKDEVIEEPKKFMKLVDSSTGGNADIFPRKMKKHKVKEAEYFQTKESHLKLDSGSSDSENRGNIEGIGKIKKLKRQKTSSSSQHSDIIVIKEEELQKQGGGGRQLYAESSENDSDVSPEEQLSMHTSRQIPTKYKGKSKKLPNESYQLEELCKIPAISISKRQKSERSEDNMSAKKQKREKIKDNMLAKKQKKERCEDNSSVTSTNELENKGHKNEEVEIRNKKLSKQSVEDTESELLDNEVSQEKEVSTSNVIYVEGEEAGDNSNTSEKSNEESLHSNCLSPDIDMNEDYKPGPKSKRRRRHAKKKKKCVLSEKEKSLVGNSVPHSSAYNCFPMNVDSRNVSTYAVNKHITFGSDDEVTSCSSSCNGNEIEIVGHITKTPMKHISSPNMQDPRNISENSLGTENQGVIDVEEEDNINTGAVDLGSDVMSNVYSPENSFSQEALATIQRMSQQKSLTIVSVTSKTTSVTTKSYGLPDMSEPIVRRGPPSPPNQLLEANENTKNMFRKLLSLQNLSQPLILQPSRKENVLGDEDYVNLDMSEDRESHPLSSQMGPQKNPTAEFADLICMPDLYHSDSEFTQVVDKSDPSARCSSNSDNECTQVVEKPGPSTRCSKKSAPRPYHAIGKFLTSLRNSDRSGEVDEKFQPVTNLEDNIQDRCSPILEMVEDNPLDPKRDCIITSKVTDAESADVQCPAEIDVEVEGCCASDVNYNPQETMEGLTEESSNRLNNVKDAGDNKGSSFSKYPLMKTLPRVGEFLAIKRLTLDENLCPVMSSYIKVQVLEVCGLRVKMKTVLNVMQGEAVTKIKDEDGVEEVDLTLEEEDLTGEEGKVIDLDWRDIFEPRLLFP